MICQNCQKDVGISARCPDCHALLLKKPLPHHLPEGTVIGGRYKIAGVLGEGGFGITYLGLNVMLGLPVAIKEYFPHGVSYRSTVRNNEVYVGSDEGEAFFTHGREQFLREARVLVRYNSEPGVVSVIDFVEENNTAYLVMEYLDGETLQQYLRRSGVLSADEVIGMLEPMMRTLEKVHAAGVIHRDISADNIMTLKNGQVKLMDFGAAREFDDSNRSMSVMLKKGYAPEEQYRRKGEQGPWTDVYALCATIYRCITGKAPTDSLDRLSGEPLIKPSQLGAKITPAQENVLMYGLALYKKDRCQSITQLLELLERAKSAPAAAEPIALAAETLPKQELTVAVTPQKQKAKAVAAPDPIKAPPVEEPLDPYVTMVAEAPQAPIRPKTPKHPSLHTVQPLSRPLQKSPKPPQAARSTKEQRKKKKKKVKIIAGIAAVLLLIAVFVILIVNHTGMTYTVLDDGTAVITSYTGLTGSESTIHIPSELDGHQVAGIGNDAFAGHETMTTVTIPDTVTVIGDGAFSDCRSLTSVAIPDSVTMIGDEAFYGCDKLTSVTIPDSVTTIGVKAFYNCSSMRSLTIGNSVERISESAFCGCRSLIEVTIPDSVTEICTAAFNNCSKLICVTIPESVTKIGDMVFVKRDDLVIYGKKGSAAEAYATEHDISFLEN